MQRTNILTALVAMALLNIACADQTQPREASQEEQPNANAGQGQQAKVQQLLKELKQAQTDAAANGQRPNQAMRKPLERLLQISQQQKANNYRNRLGTSEDEFKVLFPLIEKVMNLREQLGAGRVVCQKTPLMWSRPWWRWPCGTCPKSWAIRTLCSTISHPNSTHSVRLVGRCSCC